MPGRIGRTVFFFFTALPALAMSTLALSALKAEEWKERIGRERLQILESHQTLPATFYVAPTGNDAWSGRLSAPNGSGSDGPFRTLHRAQAAVRDYRTRPEFQNETVVVEVGAGRYEFDKPLLFGEADSGSADAPIVWRGQGDATILEGGRYLNAPQPIADPEIYNRLKPEIRDRVIQFDLNAAEVTDFGLPEKGDAELFFDHRPMTVARYPDEGFITIKRLETDGTTPVDIRGTKGIVEGKFYFDDEEFLTWEKEKDIWVLGYWFWDWDNKRQKVMKIDPARKSLELSEPYSTYGYRVDQYYYVYNVLAELDQPGEFYLDRESGILYFYPPEEMAPERLLFSLIPNLVRLENASHLVWSGFLLEGCRGDAVTISGDGVVVCGCEVRNVGGYAMGIQGRGHLIFGNHLHELGGGGISIHSGDRRTLAGGGAAIVNNHIHDYGRLIRVYAPAVRPTGCGIYLAHNRFMNAPHSAVHFSGCDIIMEFNEISDVCLESNDAGAIYAGGTWINRGNVIRNNYLHDILGYQNRGCDGVYLDDMFSGTEVSGNLFFRVCRAAFIGGGVDNTVVNNLFIDCRPAVHVDARGLDWAAPTVNAWVESVQKEKKLEGIPFLEAPYIERYPELARIADGNPRAPERNLIARNVVIRDKRRLHPEVFEGDSIEEIARPYLTFENNVRWDYRLLAALTDPESSNEPLVRNLKFSPIPFGKIGLFPHPAAVAGE